ncbi:MAG: ComEC/Rec2 family competence protein [Pyrinomonadaceae bacterium]|nr:ComEC/Rec2 family competence protein [Pyrinomonadaceae bacterium]
MSASSPTLPRRKSSSNPLIWLAVCYSVGILFARSLPLDWKLLLVFAIVAGAVSIVSIGRKRRVIPVFLAFFLAGAFIFQVQYQAAPTDSLRTLYDTNQFGSDDPIEIEGVLESRPEPGFGGMFFVLETEKAIYKMTERTVSGRVRFFAPIRDNEIRKEYQQLNLHYGVRLRIACNLNREERYLNPGSASFKRILDQKNLDALATVKSPLLIERLEDDRRFQPLGPILDYRQNLIRSFRDNFNLSTSGILIASLLGNRQFLTRDTAEIFRSGGTFHVLVISGLHITFLGGMMLIVVRKLTKRRSLQFLATSAALWIYSIAVGAELPVVRAALMFTILLFSSVVYRKRNLLNTLGGCALLILIWRPDDLFSQSFHLTFASLLGIIAVAFPMIEKLRLIGSWRPSAKNPFPPKVSKQLKTFCELLYWSEAAWIETVSENLWDCRLFKSEYAARLENSGLQKPLRWLFEGITVTAVVQVFLLPFLVLYFHRVSYSSVLTNLWVGIFIVLQNMAAVFAILFAEFSSSLALPLISLAEAFNWVLLVIPRVLISADLASARIPIYTGPFGFIYKLYFIPLFLIVIFVKRWNPFGYGKRRETRSRFYCRLVFLSSICLFLMLFFIIVFHPFSTPRGDGRLTMEFLDVGQGDSIFIRFPNGKTLLIDGGGKHDFQNSSIERSDGAVVEFRRDAPAIGESVVSEFLWEKGYSEIDMVLATHSDADHIQGLADVVRNFGVKAVFVGRDDHGNRDFDGLRNAAAEKELDLTKIQRGDTFMVGNVKIEVLNPRPGENGNAPSNDNSIVIRLSYGSKKFLLTGDIESASEKNLLKAGHALTADVVKVAHHGSRTSSSKAFIDATEAGYAVIPVGKRSRFGHPHNEVVRRWRKAGAKVMTTGEKGTISVSTNGKDLQIQTYVR